jgi:hypothetical protein
VTSDAGLAGDINFVAALWLQWSTA